MTRGIFVTGTDTGVGKSLVAAALIRGWTLRGYRVAGLKPVASGSDPTPAGLRNEDALLLQREANVALPYAAVNPYAFAPAIAPHLAAAEAGIAIELPVLVAAYQSAAAVADIVVVEGAGGWRVPLGPDTYLSDLPEALSLAVVLVVGLRLGCLNHALLTAESIGRTGRATLLGWVGNSIDPDFQYREENVATLQERLAVPCLGIVPPLAPVSVAAATGLLSLPA